MVTVNTITENVARDHENKNTKYIQSLTYDLRKLLAVDLTPEQKNFQDENTYEHDHGKVVIVTKKVRDASADITENLLLNPSAGTIYPGAVIKQNQALAEGVPTPYCFHRAPLTIRVDLPGLEERGRETIASPSNVNVEVAIQKIVDFWLNNISGGDHGYQQPVRAYSESRKAFSRQQIGIECGFGAQWGKSQATMDLKVDSDNEETIVYRVFKQVYFSVHVEEPETSGGLFSPEVILDESNMSASEPPGFVRSVDYGRIIILQMITSAKATKQEAEATLDYKSTGKKVTADLQEKYENIAKNSVFKAIVLGGGSGSADVIMGDTEKIKEVLIQGIVFSKSNPAYPLSYTVADLKTRATSQCRLTTKYIETNCQTLYDRTITFKHTGGFVANFHITWNEYDKLSKTVVTKTWFSNDQTAPYEYMLTFPGDASDFHVEARYAIWIKTWRSKFLNFPVLAKDNTIVNLHGPTWDCKMEAW